MSENPNQTLSAIPTRETRATRRRNILLIVIAAASISQAIVRPVSAGKACDTARAKSVEEDKYYCSHKDVAGAIERANDMAMFMQRACGRKNPPALDCNKLGGK